VIENQRLAGVITVTDLLRVLTRLLATTGGTLPE
jgi:hypothetical protein